MSPYELEMQAKMSMADHRRRAERGRLARTAAELAKDRRTAAVPGSSGGHRLPGGGLRARAVGLLRLVVRGSSAAGTVVGGNCEE